MKTQKERMLNQELYLASDSELRRDAQNCKRLLRLINQTDETQVIYRKELLKELFGQTAENVYVEPPFYCGSTSNSVVTVKSLKETPRRFFFF